MSLMALEWTLAELRRELTPALAGAPMRRNVALFGSAVLARWGLRDRVGDVDVFVRPWVFARLSVRPSWRLDYGEHPDHPAFIVFAPDGLPLEVHAFSAWRADQPEIDPGQALDAAELDVTGWPLTPLAIVRHHKAMALERFREYGRPAPRKHVEDLEAIDEVQPHLNELRGLVTRGDDEQEDGPTL